MTAPGPGGALASLRVPDRAGWAALWHYWREPLVAWAIVGGFNLATVLIRGIWTAHDAAVHYWFSVDAEIPEDTARWLLGMDAFLPDWSPFDRGPLQAIILLVGGPLLTGHVAAYIVGVIVNSAWILGLYPFLRALGAEQSRVRTIVVLTALTGPIWLFSVYPWPKLLAGALTLGCAAAILQRRPVLAGVLGGLAMSAHGSSLYALIGLVPWMVARLRRRMLITVALMVIPSVAWGIAGSIFGTGVRPRLLQWHLAGRGTEARSALSTIAHAYWDAGFASLMNKIDNVRTMLGDPTVWDQPSAIASWGGVLGTIRKLQVTRVFLAPGILLVGLVGVRRVPRTLILMVAAWTVAYALLEWGGTGMSAAWLHTAPFALVLGWIAVCAYALPRWMIAVQGALLVGMWIFAPAVGF